MKRFVVLTCLWKRPEVSRIVLSWYARQRERLASDFAALGYEVDLVAVGSEGAFSRYLAEDCGWRYLEWPNQPLSDKWNAGVAFAHHGLRADATYIVGSDDLSSDAYVLKVASMMREGADHAGSLDCYVACPYLKRATHITPMRHTDSAIIGAGRAMSRRAAEKCGVLPYQPGKGWGIDPTMDRRFAELGIEQSSFTLDGVPGAMLLDVKTSDNIWPFQFFRDMGLPEDYDEVLAPFGDAVKRQLSQLPSRGEHELDQFLDPILHRVAASLLALLVGEIPTVVELGHHFEFGRHLRGAILGSRYLTEPEWSGGPADAFVIFDSGLTVEDQLRLIGRLPHNSHVMVSVPQAPFSSYEEAERRYGELLVNFTIKVIGRWWLGCGTSVEGGVPKFDQASEQVLQPL